MNTRFYPWTKSKHSQTKGGRLQTETERKANIYKRRQNASDAIFARNASNIHFSIFKTNSNVNKRKIPWLLSYFYIIFWKKITFRNSRKIQRTESVTPRTLCQTKSVTLKPLRLLGFMIFVTLHFLEVSQRNRSTMRFINNEDTFSWHFVFSDGCPKRILQLKVKNYFKRF